MAARTLGGGAAGARGGRMGVIHIHSAYSHDGVDTLERLRVASVKRGITFVGLTDHAEDLEADEFGEYLAHCAAVSDATFAMIPGLEFRFAGHPGLHLLALGLRHWIDPKTPAEFIEQARGAATFTIVAHPVLAGHRVPPEVAGGIDAIEVWNAAYNTRWLPDPRSVRILHEIRRTRPSVVGTAGLDQHDSANDRETRVTVLDPAADPLLQLKAGRFVNSGRHFVFDPAVSWGPAKLGALGAARWAFDRVERAQEKIMRRVKKMRQQRMNERMHEVRHAAEQQRQSRSERAPDGSDS